LPEERIRYHICWGSFNTPHVTDVSILLQKSAMLVVSSSLRPL
jgi:hypothetical protein